MCTSTNEFQDQEMKNLLFFHKNNFYYHEKNVMCINLQIGQNPNVPHMKFGFGVTTSATFYTYSFCKWVMNVFECKI